jgi:protein TonB
VTPAYAVSGVLERRAQETEGRLFGRCIAAATAFHFVALAVALLAPRFTTTPSKPIEYVAIQIVPAARLGVEKPPPPKPEPEKPIESRPVETLPPPSPDTPVLPKPEPAKPAKPLVQARPEPAKPAPKPQPAEAPAEALPEVRGSERGAAAGLALGASVAGLDNPDFTYGYYVDQMLAMIQANWVRPMVGSGVEATIYYRIARNGRLTEVRIANSSGINSFDLAALRAVQATNPLPPLPRAFRDSWLGVHLIFR